MMGDLSEHFSRSEFRCHHCGRLPDETTLGRLVAGCERLRSIVGRPMRIVSGFRCAYWQAHVDPAVHHSRHTVGDAVDVVNGYCTIDQAHAAGFTGIGVCDGEVVHIDRRPKAVTFRDC